MNKTILVLSLLFGIFSYSKESHREHEAHVHGAGELGIAFDDLKGHIDFKIPSESLFGFEYKPTVDKDIKTMNEALLKLENQISDMIFFDKKLNCITTKEKIEVVYENHGNKKKSKNKKSVEMNSGHSETKAVFLVKCEKSPLGTQIVFNFQKYFSKIKDLDIKVLIGSLQKSIEAKQTGTVLDLK